MDNLRQKILDAFRLKNLTFYQLIKILKNDINDEKERLQFNYKIVDEFFQLVKMNLIEAEETVYYLVDNECSAYPCTIIIYTAGESEIEYFIINADLRHLNHVYINSNEKLDQQNELCKLLYGEGGNYKFNSHREFPIDLVKQGAYVIACKFL